MTSAKGFRERQDVRPERAPSKTGPDEQWNTAGPSTAGMVQHAVNNPHSLSPGSIFQLQGAAGNRMVGQLLGQTTNSPPIQNKNKTGLPDRLKAGVESLSGISLNDVKVHYNSDKPAQVQAQAYAQGTDIFVGSGQEKHLPHEAWHIVQQKQGRVKPTTQLKGLQVNSDPGLEGEADRMGSKALRIHSDGNAPIGEASPPQASVSAATGISAPLQAVFVKRADGSIEWEEDPYELQKGESIHVLEQFMQTPQVVYGGGGSVAEFDDTGTQSTSTLKRKEHPMTHKELQKIREKQGERLRKRMKKSPKNIKKETKELKATAEELEELAGDVLPDDHEDKVSNVYGKGSVTGTAFRNLSKGQDEFTQSQASTSFLRGFRQSGGDTPPHYSQQLDDYGEQLLRTMSAFRGPTSAIVAPIDDDGTMTGQQHPTGKDQQKLPGGGSGHSYADRGRVQRQNEVFDEVSQIPGVPPNAIFLSSMLASGVSTLSTMSAPLSASNIPTFNNGYHEQQHEDRERIKGQTNLLAGRLNIPTASTDQYYDEPWTEHETPTSPRRMDEEETKKAKKKKKQKSKTQ